MAIWSFNAGEWTEAYVFLRLLGEGKLYAADAEFKKDLNVFLRIVEILRNERSGLKAFNRDMQTGVVMFKSGDPAKGFKVVTADELTDKAAFLYEAIKKGMARIPEIQEYLEEEMELDSPKAVDLHGDLAEQYGAKADIIIKSVSSIDSFEQTEGYSIKSYLGSKPTLFNSSPSSGFKYEVVGCDKQTAAELNLITEEGEQKMYAAIRDKGLSVEYRGERNECFRKNLFFIDSSMGRILSTAVLAISGFYGDYATDMRSVAKKVAEIDPLGIGSEDFYTAKFKDLVFDSFSGMTASTMWDGKRTLAGGYIDVSASGEILYYRAMSDNVFMSYLFANTKFDRPSRGVNKDLAVAKAKAFLDGIELSEDEARTITTNDRGRRKDPKGNCGFIYEEDGKFFVDMNFQIRFK